MEARNEHTLYVGITEAYNYDLNTGEQISLKDVFTDDADYIAILNDYLKRKLARGNSDEEEYYSGEMEFAGLKLTGPFRGISEDQDFFLFQGGLGLIFDQDDPQFETGLYPTTVYINFADLGENIAITQRFYDEGKDIFESDAPIVKEFLQAWPGIETGGQKSEMIGKVSVYYSYRYPETIPEEARLKCIELAVLDTDRIAELEKQSGNTDNGGPSFEQYVWAGRSGPYTTVIRNINTNNYGKWDTFTENYCFDADGRELELADLFIPGYDYETAIRKALKDTVDKMERKPAATIDELYGSMSFSIGLAEISFMTLPVEFDVNSSYPINFYMPYKDIGCDNLTLFD